MLAMNTIVYSSALVQIRSAETNRVLFQRVRDTWDATPVVREWGAPVGTMWGTYLEIWAMGLTACARIYPNCDPRGLSVVLAECLGAKVQTPDEILQLLKGGRR